MKSVAEKARPTSKVGIKHEPSQIDWHRNWARAGGTSFYLVQLGERERYLLYARIAQREGLTVALMREYARLPPNCSQLDVLHKITGR